jgi:uncharacterized protein (DUF427 family)
VRIRPPLAPGQEWAWDYPRPPRLERSRRLVRVLAGGIEVARSDCTLRVLETSHAPVYYIPPDDVLTSALQRVAGSSFCEWKGVASYYDFVTGERRIARAAWTYTDPTPSFAELANYVAFYPSRVDECFVGDERVRPQVGDFYVGWITSEILGPFKGTPGTSGW